MNERQQNYLDALRERGSAPKARQVAGVTHRTVSNWEKDEEFAEAAAEAQEAANDAILQRSRELAMAGDSKLLSTWMKALIPSLRPLGAQVAVGVQVNGAERRLAQMSDAELLPRGEQIIRDVQMRGEALPLPAGDAIDANQVLCSLPAPESPVGPEIDPESVL